MTQTPTRDAPAAPEGRQPDLPRLGLGGGLRFLWTQLSSMRTALVLLFALALAAIPGSLVPQRKVSPVRVSEFISAHPTLGPIYDKVGMFGVYTSPWFSAIYLLLFVSLVGCIIPRVGVYGRAVRARPPKTPRNLARLPAYATAELPDGDGSSDEADVLDRAAEILRAQRYRVDRHEEQRGRRTRLPARGRQSGLPHQPAVRPARGRDRWALGLPRDQRGDRRAGLRQQPHPVRRLLRRCGVLRLGPAPVQRGGEELRREVRDRAGAARRGAAVQGRRRGHRSPGCAAAGRDARGQQAAEHRRHDGAPDRTRVRRRTSPSRTPRATSPSPDRS